MDAEEAMCPLLILRLWIPNFNLSVEACLIPTQFNGGSEADLTKTDIKMVVSRGGGDRGGPDEMLFQGTNLELVDK